MTTLYLASRSPRRKFLLQQLGIDFEVVDVDINEIPGASESALDYVRRIALEKAVACRQSMPKNLPVLAADTEVVLDNHILGKPVTRDDAIRMLQSLSGRGHQVHTAVVLLRDVPVTLVNSSRVWFRSLTLQECQDYCDTCHPLDKAGAYGIQDKAAGFIQRFEGSYSGVMGLPLMEPAELLGVRSEE
jgi:septum formation protein